VLQFDDRIRFGAAEARYESSEATGLRPLPNSEQTNACLFWEHDCGADDARACALKNRAKHQNPNSTSNKT
jgi:hypothetical protein